MDKEMTRKDNRVWQYDAIKLFLIFLVVLGHILETFIENNHASTNILRMRFWIYSFHMPLFLFISGLFSKKNIDERRYANISYYLVLYIVTKIILFLNNAIQYNKYNFSLLSESGIAWYCFAIFVFSTVTILFSKKRKSFILISAIIIGCIIGYDQSIGDLLVLSRIIVFYPFFYAGYCFNQSKLINKLSKRSTKLISIIILVIFTLITFFYINEIYWLSPLLSGRNPFVKLGEYYYLGGIIRYIYYIIVFVIIISIITIFVNLKKDRTIYTRGKNTLPVYVLHYIPITTLFFGKFNPMIWMNKILPICPSLLSIITALLLTLFFSLDFWNKPFEFIKKKVTETTNY